MKVKKCKAACAKTVAAATAVKKTAAKAAKTSAKKVTFTFRSEPGKQVYLTGCFLGWDPMAKQLVDKKGDGVYSAVVKLEPGRYEYKFVVDGIWCADPENADAVSNDQGTTNSVIIVA